MKIYTKTGDMGLTALWAGKRIRKDDVQVEAYGTLDELTVSIGFLLSFELEAEDRVLMTTIQRDLHQIMARLCNADVDLARISETVTDMEQLIDRIEQAKPTTPKFVLVQGDAASVAAHMARVVCRRAERRLVTYALDSKDLRKDDSSRMIQYLNRLSDALFALGRKYNTKPEVFA